MVFVAPSAAGTFLAVVVRREGGWASEWGMGWDVCRRPPQVMRRRLADRLMRPQPLLRTAKRSRTTCVARSRDGALGHLPGGAVTAGQPQWQQQWIEHPRLDA